MLVVGMCGEAAGGWAYTRACAMALTLACTAAPPIASRSVPPLPGADREEHKSERTSTRAAATSDVRPATTHQ